MKASKIGKIKIKKAAKNEEGFKRFTIDLYIKITGQGVDARGFMEAIEGHRDRLNVNSGNCTIEFEPYL